MSAIDGSVLTVFDATAAGRWAVITRASLAARRAEIDALNVFPVPDGDTGTNLYLTFDGALDAARSAFERSHPGGGRPTLHEVATDLARGMLLAARGNSGVIFAQIFQGLAEVAAQRSVDAADGPAIARALQRGSELAWTSVTRPVEGTILSVCRSSAEAACRAADGGGSLVQVSEAAVEAARRALDLTPTQLPALAQAGVVDAGGAGYLLLLEALDRVVHGDVDIPEGALRRRPGWAYAESPGPVPTSETHTLARSPRPVGQVGLDGPAYEVMYLLHEASEESVAQLKARLDALGDSVVVVGSEPLWNVHAHVDDVGAAIEAGIDAGRPARIRVTHFLSQPAHGEHSHGPDAGSRDDRLGLVVCASGPGLVEVAAASGAAVVPSGPAHRASAGDLLAAIHGTRTMHVILVPNDPDMALAAESAVRLAADVGVTVSVVPARADVQVMAAMAVFDPGDDVLTAADDMRAAVRDTAYGAVAVASKAATTPVGPCAAGDYLGLVGDEIAFVGNDVETVMVGVLDTLVTPDSEIVTLVTGADLPPPVAATLRDAVEGAHPHVEVVPVPGGQPIYHVLLGVE